MVMVWVSLCGNHLFKLPLVLFLAYRKFSRDVLERLKFTIFQKEVQHLFEHQAAIKSLHKALTSLDVNYIVSKCRFAFIINKKSLKSTEKQLREGRSCSCIDRFYSGQLKQLIYYSFTLIISLWFLIYLKWQSSSSYPTLMVQMLKSFSPKFNSPLPPPPIPHLQKGREIPGMSEFIHVKMPYCSEISCPVSYYFIYDSYMSCDARKPVFRGFKQSEFQTSLLTYRDYLEN